MEFFLPSVLLLLVAAAVVFFVLPKFGPATLALVSAILLIMGLYQHSAQFGNEYRFSTWQLGLVSFAPYILVAGLLIMIAIYLLYLLPAATKSVAEAVSIPTVANMPPANTSTNVLTTAINNAINSAANLVGYNTNKNENGVLNTLANNINSLFTGTRNNRYPFSQI
jgi:uncharacterized membrane protein HdeD (DUF308 family)